MASKKSFNFKLNTNVALSLSGEKGTIIGRAHYTNMDPQYLVRYVNGSGNQQECWIPEDTIVEA